MRKLRVIITGVGTAAPALIAALVPTVDCGSEGVIIDASTDTFGKSDVVSDAPTFPPIDGSDSAIVDAGPCGTNTCTFTVTVPPPGTYPDLASVCAVSSPVVSNTAAFVTLANYDKNALTADGFIAVKAELLAALVSDPIATVNGSGMSVTALTKTVGGYSFHASWSSGGTSMTVKVTMQIACGDAGLDGGVQTVESTTDLELCIGTDPPAWESSGSSCIQCCVVCEMAPTPIVSNNLGDDLPLARALRLRVIEVARAGKQVVLFAQNDAGESAEYDWRISGGSIERVADDVVVWTLPDDRDDRPFGQLAVWNDDGAIVENFYWGAA